MAASVASITTRFSPVSFAPKGNIRSGHKSETVEEATASSDKSNCWQREQKSVRCTPVVLEFRRLVQSAKFKSVDVIPGVPNHELLHAVIALYDTCLPDITPEVLYFTVCGKWAKTLLLIRDIKDVALEVSAKANTRGSDTGHATCSTDDLQENHDEGAGMSNTKLNGLDSLEESRLLNEVHETNGQAEKSEQSTEDELRVTAADGTQTGSREAGSEETKKIFADVFSDSESEKDSDSEEEEDYTAGQSDFLRRVVERRKARQQALAVGSDPSPHLGIESRLVACATWEKSTVRPGEKNIQIDLLAVRRRYRKLGIGKYLLQTLKDASVVGFYDALLVYADNGAVDFFNHYGFDDDIVLNSKFSDLADNWTNCTLMCYLPPFSAQTIWTESESDTKLDLKLMELELQKWTAKSREAHQAQMACAARLRHEVISLRALVSAQHDLVHSLTQELEVLGADKFRMEKEFLQQRLSDLKVDVGLSQDSSKSMDAHGNDSSDDEETEQLIRDLEQRIRSCGTTESPRSDSLINWKVAEEFKQSMDDPVMAGMCVVSSTIKASVCDSAVEMFKTRCSQLRDPSMCTKMYLSGTLQHPEDIPRMLAQGFTEQDFSHGEYGVGLYFSQHASKAAHFSALGKLLVVEVGLGKTDSVVKSDNTRTAPPDGFDTIVTPGRLSLLSGGDGMMTACQEYVIFDPNQALPVYLIEYQLE